MFNNFQEFNDFAAENGILMVDFKEIDLAGRWHHLTIPVERFTAELLRKGVAFDGSSYGFLTVERSDMVFIPDLTSAFVDPVSEMPTVTMIGDIFRITDDGLARFESDPRYIAGKAEQYLRDSGIADTCLFGPEFEFYLLDSIEFRNQLNHIEVHIDSEQAAWNSINSPYDLPHQNRGFKVMGKKGYHADIPYDVGYELRNLIVRALEENGVPVKYHHCENGGP
ncbi:MAG: glutamine synthetase beta-grasp domain-containing protein, partial [Oscillospiraceae bacterium]|nr:glutamine synthetase beta-grasp domain-containing protein [Oscillospiraceae bacterium]